MAWHVAPSLAALRTEVNTRWPTRDRASDGTIGDAAHQAGTSDHNPNGRGSVNAWDMDKDGVDVWAVIAAFERHPSAHYWIYQRQIADRDSGWARRPYAGSNPHDKHAHFSIRQSAAAEQDQRPWGLLEDDMTPDQARQLADLHKAFVGTPHDWADGRTTARLMTDLGYALLHGRPGTETTWIAQQLAALGRAAGLDAAELAAIGDRLEVELAEADIPAATVEAFGAADSDEEVADRLRAALGDRAASVGALLAGRA